MKKGRVEEQKLSDGLLMPIAFIYSMTKQNECFDDGGSNEDEEVYPDDSEPEAAAIDERPLCPVCMDPTQIVNSTFIPCGQQLF